jgi:hypothetical protein
VGRRVGVLILVLGVSALALLIPLLRDRAESGPGGPLPPSSAPGVEGRVRVEVLNGGGVPGVAWEATELLRDQGFDVVYFGNARTYSEDSSVVMDRGNEESSARAVAEVLGIPHVVSEPDSSLLLDVTVRLGPEWGSSPSGGESSGTSSSKLAPGAAIPAGMTREPGPGLGL